MPTILAKRATRVPRSIVFLLAGFVVVTGVQCRDSAPTDPVDATPLVGTEWRLVSLEPGAPLVSAAPQGREPLLSFDRYPSPPRLSVGARGPCNAFGGAYDATPEGSLWIQSPLLGTRIGCEGERGALEDAYLDRLYATVTWARHADSLVLHTTDERWLRFVRQ